MCTCTLLHYKRHYAPISKHVFLSGKGGYRGNRFFAIYGLQLLSWVSGQFQTCWIPRVWKITRKRPREGSLEVQLTINVCSCPAMLFRQTRSCSTLHFIMREVGRMVVSVRMHRMAYIWLFKNCLHFKIWILYFCFLWLKMIFVQSHEWWSSEFLWGLKCWTHLW